MNNNQTDSDMNTLKRENGRMKYLVRESEMRRVEIENRLKNCLIELDKFKSSTEKQGNNMLVDSKDLTVNE